MLYDTSEPELTPTRPYMIRAIYEWLEDNLLTPYVMVDTTVPNVDVPVEHIQEDRIVLNIASQATGNLTIDNDYIHFNARFGGVSREIWVPIQAVIGIYAKENSQGMFFDPNEYANYQGDFEEDDFEEEVETTQETPRKKPTLRILD